MAGALLERFCGDEYGFGALAPRAASRHEPRGEKALQRYRVEIDGLRAIAVLLVVLFHLWFSRLGNGGFVGVDVFFVISGYLITDHLRRDLVQGPIGILEFYRRRIIRIFPALFVVYLVCAAATLAFLFPSQLASFQKALISSVWFSSNVYLFETVGYFDFRARANPLIHTWSL
jgi:peptidoglycan/LPS O-acetylase OafA/YrhL